MTLVFFNQSYQPTDLHYCTAQFTPRCDFYIHCIDLPVLSYTYSYQCLKYQSPFRRGRQHSIHHIPSRRHKATSRLHHCTRELHFIIRHIITANYVQKKAGSTASFLTGKKKKTHISQNIMASTLIN